MPLASARFLHYSSARMDIPPTNASQSAPGQTSGQPHRRRPRYSGKYPRRFEDKYKEHASERFADTVQKVLGSGKTPAGMHRPIMVAEVLSALSPQQGQVMVDCTLGYGGHAGELLPRLCPGGRLLGFDQDPLELPKTAARLQASGFGSDVFTSIRSNFAALARELAQRGIHQVDGVLADLGVSSMQLDNPARGFSIKENGPLDMRMNPNRGQTASSLLSSLRPEKLEAILAENSDEPFAARISQRLAGQHFETSHALVAAIRTALSGHARDEVDLAVRRTFQALRIAVNDEFSALDSLLRQLPECLRPGGRVAILSFHSGEDRRIKKAFAAGRAQGVYCEISSDVIRPSPGERRDNPRSGPAKLRWARKADAPAPGSAPHVAY
jgi:16S rRNA (cytosine1402-N4)-methyltransferase